MTSRNDLATILACLREAREAGAPAVLATVLNVEGSAYRQPGARLVLLPDGVRVGLISGGCLEGDVARKAWYRTEHGPAVVRYDTAGDGDEAFAFGSGCRGTVEVLLERVDPRRPPGFLAILEHWQRDRIGGILVRAVGPDAAHWLCRSSIGECQTDAANLLLTNALREFAEESAPRRTALAREWQDWRLHAEAVSPPVALLVCGAGPDVPPMVALARALGWQVTVADRRSAATSRARIGAADAYLSGPPAETMAAARLLSHGGAIVMSHNYDDDRDYLRALLATEVRYLGVLGPRKRTDSLLADLGLTRDDANGRLHSPLGLDLGSETPEEIALAAIAEAKAVPGGRAGGQLRDRAGPVHEWPPEPNRPTTRRSFAIPAGDLACAVGGRP